MGTLSRGVRNVLRNRTRSLLVILLVALAVAVFATMAQAGAASQGQARSLAAQAGTVIIMSSRGGQTANNLTDEEHAAQVVGIANIVRVEKYLRRSFADNAQRYSMMALTAMEPGAALRPLSVTLLGGTPRLVEGRAFLPEEADADVAIVGRIYAEQYGLTLGSEVVIPTSNLRIRVDSDPSPAPELRARVVGIYEGGVVLGDNQVFVPLGTVQRVLGIPGQFSQLYIHVDSAENVAQVRRDLDVTFGQTVDLVTFEQTARLTAESMAAVRRSSFLAAAVAAAIGGGVVLSATALVTRERRQEIGTLRALGASNKQVAAQFAAEALTVALLGGLLGLGLAAAAGSALTGVILGALGSGEAAQTIGYAPSAATAAYGLGLALLFGALGSLYTASRTTRLRPAEAMRAQ
jgi:putative ABC transport system permease protein